MLKFSTDTSTINFLRYNSIAIYGSFSESLVGGMLNFVTTKQVYGIITFGESSNFSENIEHIIAHGGCYFHEPICSLHKKSLDNFTASFFTTGGSNYYVSLEYSNSRSIAICDISSENVIDATSKFLDFWDITKKLLQDFEINYGYIMEYQENLPKEFRDIPMYIIANSPDEVAKHLEQHYLAEFSIYNFSYPFFINW